MHLTYVTIDLLNDMRSFRRMTKENTPIKQFLHSVGRPRFRDAIGVSDQQLTRAVDDGVMPASWYFDVRDWCVANLIDVPEHLFRRRSRKLNNNISKQNVKPSEEFQGGAQ